jgi:hypothetical protein
LGKELEEGASEVKLVKIDRNSRMGNSAYLNGDSANPSIFNAKR